MPNSSVNKSLKPAGKKIQLTPSENVRELIKKELMPKNMAYNNAEININVGLKIFLSMMNELTLD
jgi:hypothetical protein